MMGEGRPVLACAWRVPTAPAATDQCGEAVHYKVLPPFRFTHRGFSSNFMATANDTMILSVPVFT